MRCELIELDGEPGPLAKQLRALVPAAELIHASVAEILAEVRLGGDEALRRLTARFDTAGDPPPPLRVTPAELDAAERSLDPAVRTGLERANENVRRVAEAAPAQERKVQFPHHEVTVRVVALARAAVYVPGGRAPYPSTVVMGVTTARVAGVKDVVVCAPPTHAGDVHSVILAACRLAGADAVYRMGGAQAIAALAYGTETVEPVQVIVGPGSLHVQEAKRQVSGHVGIDGFAGPSDLVLVAGEELRDPEPLALDLLAQAEHGQGSLVVAIARPGRVLQTLYERLREGPETGAVVRVVAVSELEEAIELVQALAPEHVQLAGTDVELHAGRLTTAGCVFVGEDSGTAFGDYIAGSNHVLPTGGASRFASALSPEHFRRRFTEVRVEDGSELARAAAPVARAEGFEMHARSMEARIRDNRKP